MICVTIRLVFTALVEIADEGILDYCGIVIIGREMTCVLTGVLGTSTFVLYILVLCMTCKPSRLAGIPFNKTTTTPICIHYVNAFIPDVNK